MKKSFHTFWPLISLFAGAVTTLAFAPFDLSLLVFVSVAVVFYFWNSLPLKQATLSAGLFSFGLQCTGVSWIFHSVHTHGDAPAYFAVLLVILLCIYLSLYAALAVYIVNRFLPNRTEWRFLLFYPAAWLVFEWLQGYVMTGFSWMQLGYTQIDFPLSGYAPVFGNHAISGLIAFCAGALLLVAAFAKQIHSKSRVAIILSVIVVWGLGGFLKTIAWTHAEGEPIRVSMIQGNIAQQDKWKNFMKQPTLNLYRDLSLRQKDVDLIIWPETAVPDYWYRVVPYIKQLRADMKQKGTDLLLGIFVKNDESRLLNSVMSIHGGVYNKRHLVPLGEYIPLRFLIEFFNRFVNIPMSDIASGDDDQPLLSAAGIPVGTSICFEEAFSRDVLKDLPEAKILVNVSNDAWFEDSHEAHQHHTIARMRALEAGRYMMRSTNTGVTSFIGPHGEVIKQLPQFEVGVLNSEVQPMAGSTPFVRWGDTLIVSICSVLLFGFWFKYRRQVKH